MEGLIRFLKLAGRLKKEPRRGWVIRAGVAKPESVGDHTFRTALTAMILGDMRGLDTEKMVKMALLHDIGEALIGDLTPLDSGKDKEAHAVGEILENLPEGLRSRYLELWRELHDGSSTEARLVADIDRFEMALQASEYEEEGYSKETMGEFKASAARSIRDGELLKLLRHI